MTLTLHLLLLISAAILAGLAALGVPDTGKINLLALAVMCIALALIF